MKRPPLRAMAAVSSGLGMFTLVAALHAEEGPGPTYAPPAYAPPTYAPPAYAPSYGPQQPGADVGASREPRRKKKEKPFEVGVLGGIGFPRPLAIEGLVRLDRLVGLGLEYSTAPNLTIYDVETRYWALAGDIQFFPLRGPFFFGVRGGRQHLSGHATFVDRGRPVSGSASVDTTFVNPRLGFLWTFDPGFSVGIDAGVQVPLSSTVKTDVPPGTVASVRVKRVTDAVADSVLPTVDLIRLGFLL
jgi:hypothetical protein